MSGSPVKAGALNSMMPELRLPRRKSILAPATACSARARGAGGATGSLPSVRLLMLSAAAMVCVCSAASLTYTHTSLPLIWVLYWPALLKASKMRARSLFCAAVICPSSGSAYSNTGCANWMPVPGKSSAMRAGVVVIKPLGDTTSLSNLILMIFWLSGSEDTLISVMLPAKAAGMARLRLNAQSVLMVIGFSFIRICPLNYLLFWPACAPLSAALFSGNSALRKIQLP